MISLGSFLCAHISHWGYEKNACSRLMCYRIFGWIFSISRELSIQLHFVFPHSSIGKESACNVGDLGLIPGLERSSGEGKGYPNQYSGLENCMDCIVHGIAKSWTWLSDFPFHFQYPPQERVHVLFPWWETFLISKIQFDFLEKYVILLGGYIINSLKALESPND